MPDKLPPFSLDAERAILAACLGDAKGYLKVSDYVEPQDFYSEKHAYVFDAIGALAVRNEPVDLVMVVNELGKRGQLESVGGSEFISALIDPAAVGRPIERYAEIVQSAAMSRSLIAAAKKIEQLGYSGSDNARELLASAQSLLTMTQRQRRTHGWRTIGEITSQHRQDMLERALNPTKARGISTGLRNLDDLLAGRGFLPGKLYMLGGLTSSGKSTLLRIILRNIALSGRHVGLLTLEQDEREVLEELAYGLSGIDRAEHERLEQPLTDDEHRRFVATLDQLQDIHTLHVDDEAGITVDDVRLRMIRLYQQHKVEVIGTDYLHIIQPGKTRKSGTREREIAEMTEMIRDTGKELGVAVALVSQLNFEILKEERRRQDFEPTLRDFRDSGAVTHLPYCVLAVHRRDYLVEKGYLEARQYLDRMGNPCMRTADGAQPVYDGLMKVKVLKQQRGKTGDAYMRFYGNLSQIEDLLPGS